MAVQIPGIAQPYKTPEMVSPVDMLQAHGLQTKNVLSDLQAQETLRGIQGRNAMTAAFANVDASGTLPQEAINRLAQSGFPKEAMDLQKKRDDDLWRQSQTLHNNYLIEQNKANTDKINRQNKIALMPYMNDVMAEQIKAYDDALKSNNPDAQNRAVQVGMDAVDRLDRMGILGNEADNFRIDARNFDRGKYEAALSTAKSFLARQKAEDTYELFTDNSGKKYRANKAGDFEVFYQKDDKWVPLAGIPPDVRPLKQPSPQQILLNTQAKTEGTEPQPMSDDTLAMDAYRYLTDGTLPPNMGHGTQGVTQATKIRNEAARIAKDMGMEPDEIRLAQLTNKAQVAAIAQLGRARAQILQFEKTASNNAYLALKASNEATRTGVPILNRGIQWAQENLAGDPTLRKFTVANETFISEYGKVMSGGYGAAQTTEGAQQRAHTLINRAANKEEYIAAINQLKQEMANRVKALNDQMGEERNRLYTGIAKPSGAQQPPAQGAPTNTIKWDELGK